MSVIEKKRLTEKIHKYIHGVKKNNGSIGNIPRSIALDFNHKCNFKCDFCYERNDLNHMNEELSFDVIRKLADEADELGYWEIILQGGELLIDKAKLLELIQSFRPERFRMNLVTNGYLLDKEYAKELFEAGLDSVGVSISTLNEEEHNSTRGGVSDAHKRALEAMDNAAEAGLTAWAQPIFGHHNSHSKELYDFLDYLEDKGYAAYFILAMPYGVWKDNYMDAEDIKIFNSLRKKYNCWFDTWDFYDRKKEKISGCWSLNRTFITPKGDVLPCPFINIKMGNIYEKSLKEIIDYGFSIKYFREFSPICIAAQNRKFREKYLQKGDERSLFDPPDAKDIFLSEDFI